MRAIGRPLPMFRRCCVVQQCRLASYSVVIQGVRGVKDDLVKQFANRAGKVVAFRRMFALNGEPMTSCLAAYANEADGDKAIETLNGQQINDQLVENIVRVQRTNFNAAKFDGDVIEWGRTEAHPNTEGRSVIMAHHRRLEQERVRKHIKDLTGGDSCQEMTTSFNRGISLMQFDTAKNAQAAVIKVDKSKLEGHPCRAAMSVKDWTEPRKDGATR
eukprot:Filipodium_phascolosomae@DN2771_c1_g1_i3.p1